MTWYYLKMRCPACIAEGKSGGITKQWYHSNCGGKLMVNDYAEYKCCKCKHISHARGWSYSCDGHSGWRGTSSSHLANAISIASQFEYKAGRAWLISFLENMGDWDNANYYRY